MKELSDDEVEAFVRLDSECSSSDDDLPVLRRGRHSKRPLQDAKADETQSKARKLAQSAVPSPAPSPSWTAAGALADQLSRRSWQNRQDLSLRPGLAEVKKQVQAAVSKTVHEGLNTSLLLVGPPGVGKSTAAHEGVCAALALSREAFKSVWCAERVADGAAAVVRLAGQVHWEERAAFRHIARSLCSAFGLSFVSSASCADNAVFLRMVLHEAYKADKSIVFVVEDFHLFTKHGKAAMLYNLLDMLQASNVRAAVIGITCRHDAVGMMEKRARSRFSHKLLLLSAPSAAASEPQDTPAAVLESLLLLSDAEEETSEAARRPGVRAWNQQVREVLQDSQVKACLSQLGDLGCSCQQLVNIGIKLCSYLQAAPQANQAESSHQITRARLPKAEQVKALLTELLERDDVIPPMLADLSHIQLQLLACAHRLTLRQQALNFEALWAEYQLGGTAGLRFQEGAAWAAFQGLQRMGFFIYVGGRLDNRVMLKRRRVMLTATVDEIQRGLAQSGVGWFALEEAFKQKTGHAGPDACAI